LVIIFIRRSLPKTYTKKLSYTRCDGSIWRPRWSGASCRCCWWL